MSPRRQVFANRIKQIRAISFARRIVLLTVLFLAIVYAGDALILTHYYTSVDGRERDARNAKAELLAEHAGRAIAAIDLSLDTIASTLRANLPIKQPTVFNQLLLDKYHKRLAPGTERIEFSLPFVSLVAFEEILQLVHPLWRPIDERYHHAYFFVAVTDVRQDLERLPFDSQSDDDRSTFRQWPYKLYEHTV